MVRAFRMRTDRLRVHRSVRKFRSDRRFRRLHDGRPTSLRTIRPAPTSVPFLRNLRFFRNLPRAMVRHVRIRRRSGPLSLLLFVYHLDRPEHFNRRRTFRFLILLRFAPRHFFLCSLLFPDFGRELGLQVRFRGFPYRHVNMMDQDPKRHVILLQVSCCQGYLCNVPCQDEDRFSNRLPILNHLTLSIGRVLRTRFLELPTFRLRKRNFHRPLLIDRREGVVLFSVAGLTDFHLRPTGRSLTVRVCQRDGACATHFSYFRLGVLRYLVRRAFVRQVRRFRACHSFRLFY